MYAVIQAGGHQYRVKQGDAITIDKVDGDIGQTVTFDKVLLVNDETKGIQVGAPFLANAKVEANIKEQKRDPKILVMKYKRRKNHKKLRGHRQHVTIVEIANISV